MGRIRLNRRKQREGIKALKNVINECNSESIKPVMAGTAISGLFVIFQDNEFFRVKNIPDTREARQLISKLGLVLNDTVEMVKTQARSSLARSDRRSNIVKSALDAVNQNCQERSKLSNISIKKTRHEKFVLSWILFENS